MMRNNQKLILLAALLGPAWFFLIASLMINEVTLGTALAFMMSVIGLSLPEIIILKKVLKWQLIGIFAGVVAFGILVVGLVFNYVAFLG